MSEEPLILMRFTISIELMKEILGGDQVKTPFLTPINFKLLFDKLRLYPLYGGGLNEEAKYEFVIGFEGLGDYELEFESYYHNLIKKEVKNHE